jgi:gliding motility-associated-like protein
MTRIRICQFFTCLGVLWLWSVAVIAQPYVSAPAGYFQVDQKKGCASLTVTLTNLKPGACAPGDPCTITYGDGTPSTQTVFTHTYTAPGTYTLEVRYQSVPLGPDAIQITVVPNIQPEFEIYACAGNGAEIRVTDNNYAQYLIDFDNDGTVEATLPFSNNIIAGPFTYPAGTHTASVKGRNLNAADNCTAKTQPFTTMATLPMPVITKLTSVDVNTATLDLTTATNVLYRLEVAINNASTFQVYKTLYGVSTISGSSLDLDQNYYCFRLGAYDPCTNTSTYSGVVCSNRLVITPQSDVMVVTSNMVTTGIVNYSITRNSAPYVTIGANPFNDIDIVCKTDYCYQVTSNYGAGSTSVSLEKCGTSFSNLVPTAIDDVTATVDVQGAVLTWTQDPAFVPVDYSVTRRSGSGTYQFYTTTPSSPYTDTGFNSAGKFCYLIDYKDQCDNNSSVGGPVCPVGLAGTLSLSNTINLTWSGYKGWKLGIKDYVLEKYNVSGTLFQAITLTPTDTVYLDDVPDPDNQYVRYRVRIRPNDPALASAYSNELEFFRNANLYAPNAFTPNNDALNDSFQVQGQYIQKMKLRIFDRWGAMVFATEKNEPWDGTSSGKAMPPTTYVWKVDITDKAGRTFSEEGTVALIR